MALNIIDCSDRKLILLGDLHGEFGTIKKILRENEQLKGRDKSRKGRYDLNTEYVTNAVLVVCGDCGFGFNKQAYYEMELAPIQNTLEEQNLMLLFLRGNHDDPEYFKEVDGKFKFNNIKFIPDYSILKTDKSISLCIGGAVSQDRSWRLKENTRLNRFTRSFKRLVYWDNERVQYDHETLLEVTKSGLNVDSLITHTIPLDFLSKNVLENLTDNPWYKSDSEVVKDMDAESTLLKDIYTFLITSGIKIKWWAFGHIHKEFFDKCTAEYVDSDETLKKENIFLFGLDTLKRWCGSAQPVDHNLNYCLGNGVLNFDLIENQLDPCLTIANEAIVEKIKKGDYSISSSDWEWEIVPRNIEVPHEYVNDNAVLNIDRIGDRLERAIEDYIIGIEDDIEHDNIF